MLRLRYNAGAANGRDVDGVGYAVDADAVSLFGLIAVCVLLGSKSWDKDFMNAGSIPPSMAG